MQAASRYETFVSHPGFIRRFCSCGSFNDCVCGRPRAASGWTVRGLTEVHQLMREHLSAAIVAQLTGRSLHDVCLALNALLGRTPAHALAALEAHRERHT